MVAAKVAVPFVVNTCGVTGRSSVRMGLGFVRRMFTSVMTATGSAGFFVYAYGRVGRRMVAVLARRSASIAKRCSACRRVGGDSNLPILCFRRGFSVTCPSLSGVDRFC